MTEIGEEEGQNMFERVDFIQTVRRFHNKSATLHNAVKKLKVTPVGLGCFRPLLEHWTHYKLNIFSTAFSRDFILSSTLSQPLSNKLLHSAQMSPYFFKGMLYKVPCCLGHGKIFYHDKTV